MGATLGILGEGVGEEDGFDLPQLRVVAEFLSAAENATLSGCCWQFRNTLTLGFLQQLAAAAKKQQFRTPNPAYMIKSPTAHRGGSALAGGGLDQYAAAAEEEASAAIDHFSQLNKYASLSSPMSPQYMPPTEDVVPAAVLEQSEAFAEAHQSKMDAQVRSQNTPRHSYSC